MSTPVILVESIIAGSAEIDRMQKEVKQITQMLTGLYPKLRPGEAESATTLNLPGEHGIWDVAIEQSSNHRGIVRMEYRLRDAQNWSESYKSDFPNSPVPLTDIKRVHDDLQALIAGFLKRVTGFEDKLLLITSMAGK